MLQKNKLTIVLDQESISMALVKGDRIAQAESISLDPAQWEDAWNGGLQQLDQPFRQLLARFEGKANRWDAELFYRSPDSLCRVEISNQDQAVSSANMIHGLRQTVGMTQPTDVHCFESSAAGSVVMGTADYEQHLQKLFAWLNRGHVKVSRMVPFATSVVNQAYKCIKDAPDGTVVFYLSDFSSVIGLVENGEMKLMRLIEIGLNSLSDVYRRMIMQDAEALENPDDNGDALIDAPDSWAHQSSADLLYKHGIPFGQHITDQRLRKVMPTMSPVLQRISIELKQTLRFASGVETPPSKLLICGPGASVPQIGVALGQSLDLHIETDPQHKQHEPTTLFGAGTITNASACDFDLKLELLPKAAIELRTRSSLGTSIKVGAVAGALFLGGQYMVANQSLDEATQQIELQTQVINKIESERTSRESINGLADSIGTAATLVTERMGNDADWVGMLSTMPVGKHDTIRINEIQGQMNSSFPVLSLSGVAIEDGEGVDASQMLSSYIKDLKQNPNVKRIEIGSTSRSRIDETTWGLNFVLSIELVQQSSRFSKLTTLGMANGGDQ